MPMKNPCHPGELLKDSFGPDGLNISVTQAAHHLGISRVTLSRILNRRASITPVLAVRLEKARLSTARFWLDMQSAYDLSRVQRRKQPKVVPFKWRSAEAA